jgi:hypothetical protein
MRSNGSVAVFVLALGAGSLGGEARAAADESATALLDKADRLFKEGEFTSSMASAQAALAATTEPNHRARAHLFIGLNSAVLGKGSTARRHFASALQDDPSLTLDPAIYKPAIVELFDKAREEVKRQADVKQQAKEPVEVKGTERAGEVPETGTSTTGLLVRGTRPFFFSLHLGGAIEPEDSLFHGFHASQELGYHFFRDSSGPALSLALSQSVGPVEGYLSDGTFLSFTTFIFQVGFRFTWDLPLGSFGLYLSPFAHLGYAYVAHLGSAILTANLADSGHAFDLQFGVMLKLLLADRWIVSLQAIGVDLLIGEKKIDLNDGLITRIMILLGGGVTF